MTSSSKAVLIRRGHKHHDDMSIQRKKTEEKKGTIQVSVDKATQVKKVCGKIGLSRLLTTSTHECATRNS